MKDYDKCNEDIARSVAMKHEERLVRDEFNRHIARTQIECIEDAKTAKFALYFILALLRERGGVSVMFPFPLDEFHDDDMNTVFQLIMEELGEKNGGEL